MNNDTPGFFPQPMTAEARRLWALHCKQLDAAERMSRRADALMEIATANDRRTSTAIREACAARAVKLTRAVMHVWNATDKTYQAFYLARYGRTVAEAFSH